ncbi:MAG: hypothetical protein Q4B54_05665 [Coriobacteriales bacterium]|nr:hypothetical protein [Coriobacteriales bacterium]
MGLVDTFDYYPSSTYCVIVSRVPRRAMEERFCALFGPDMDPDVRAYREELCKHSQAAPHGRYITRRAYNRCLGEASNAMLSEIINWLCQSYAGDVKTFVATLDPHMSENAEQVVLVQDRRTGALFLSRTRDVVVEITSAATTDDDWSEMEKPNIWAGTARSERVPCDPGELLAIVRMAEFYRGGSILYRAYLEQCAEPDHDHPMEFVGQTDEASEPEYIRLLGLEPAGEQEELRFDLRIYNDTVVCVSYGESQGFAAKARQLYPRLARRAGGALFITLQRNTTWPLFAQVHPREAGVLINILTIKRRLEKRYLQKGTAPAPNSTAAATPLARLLDKIRFRELEGENCFYPLQQGLYFPQRPAGEQWMAYNSPNAERYLNVLFDAGWTGQMWTEENASYQTWA